MPKLVFDAEGNSYEVTTDADGKATLVQQPAHIAEAHEIIRMIVAIGKRRQRPEPLTRRCGHKNVDNTSWCPDCELAEARKSGEFPP